MANNIKFYRNQYKWSQVEVSNRLNVSRSNVSKWESGDMTPSLVDLLHLCQLFHINLDQLVGVKYSSTEHLDYSLEDQHMAPTDLPDVIDYLIQNPSIVTALKNLSIQKPNERRRLEGVFVHFINTLTSYRRF
ncbi:helix-turn-helix transcriptional regulator [Fredinandcohnia sp. 179-A 10B2 NHS]|uniref:helix-turn-helix transcriptional regulator n=1 Tax=Fredinandcohnia sp. 179-A 10B2 NHS TaxID=3235176 RepID=UPI00399EFD75